MERSLNVKNLHVEDATIAERIIPITSVSAILPIKIIHTKNITKDVNVKRDKKSTIDQSILLLLISFVAIISYYSIIVSNIAIY